MATTHFFPTMKPVMFCTNSSGTPRCEQIWMKCAALSDESKKRIPLHYITPQYITLHCTIMALHLERRVGEEDPIVRDDADALAVEPAEAADDRLAVLGLELVPRDDVRVASLELVLRDGGSASRTQQRAPSPRRRNRRIYIYIYIYISRAKALDSCMRPPSSTRARSSRTCHGRERRIGGGYMAVTWWLHAREELAHPSREGTSNWRRLHGGYMAVTRARAALAPRTAVAGPPG